MNNYYQPPFPNEPHNPNADPCAMGGMHKPANITYEDLFKMNYGKKLTIHQTYPGPENKEFQGILEGSNRDYFIISDPSTGKWSFLYNFYTTHITFDEEINYHPKH